MEIQEKIRTSSNAPLPQGRVPRTQKGKARVALLKQSAQSLLASRGYEATTMTEIAAEAGASIGSLYQYFPTKTHIAKALHEDGLSMLLSRFDAVRAQGGNPSDLAERLFECLMENTSSNPALREIAYRRDADPAERKRAKDRVGARIAEALTQADPPLSPSRAMIVTILILHLADVTAPASAADGAPASALMQGEVRRMLRLYLQDTAIA
jgi:AcrR family transcriptional regulator